MYILLPEWFRKAAHRLTNITLQELDDRAGEGQLGGPGNRVLFGQLILNHELSEVANHFRRWRHLDNISQDLIGILVLLLDQLELITQSQTVSL